MNSAIKILNAAIIAMLVLAGAALFVLPNLPEAQAQRGGNQSGVARICINQNAANQFQKAYLPAGSVNAQCPSDWFLYTAPESDGGVCTTTEPPIEAKSPKSSEVNYDSTLGKCTRTIDGVVTPMIYKSFTSITQQYNGGGTTPPITPPNPATSPANPATSPTNPTTPTTNTTPPTGGCETNFHKVGPLCVPNGPGNSSSIAGETSIAGLAARIIRILLYFAGIVAVVVAIIGGYQIMTAAGNATQATNGRKTLTNALIGLAVIILSFVIVQIVMNFITKGT